MMKWRWLSPQQNCRPAHHWLIPVQQYINGYQTIYRNQFPLGFW
jgi:hypothetical protein